VTRTEKPPPDKLTLCLAASSGMAGACQSDRGREGKDALDCCCRKVGPSSPRRGVTRTEKPLPDKLTLRLAARSGMAGAWQSDRGREGKDALELHVFALPLLKYEQMLGAVEAALSRLVLPLPTPPCSLGKDPTARSDEADLWRAIAKSMNHSSRPASIRSSYPSNGSSVTLL